MNPWPFVIAAYAIVIGASVLLGVWSAVAMRRAERAADALKDRR